LLNDEIERIWKEVVAALFRHFPGGTSEVRSHRLLNESLALEPYSSTNLLGSSYLNFVKYFYSDEMLLGEMSETCSTQKDEE
jgi:hypothetical protein